MREPDRTPSGLPTLERTAEEVKRCCAAAYAGDAVALILGDIYHPGGRVGITDVTIDPDRLDPELASLAGWVACVADARPVAEYRAHPGAVPLPLFRRGRRRR